MSAYTLIVEKSPCSVETPAWAIHSTLGISSPVIFGMLPEFATEDTPPAWLIPMRHYFVSIYGPYPHYGTREFIR